VMEHHSNFVPWQQLALENGATLKVIDIDRWGYLQEISNIISKRTKILALTYVSNVLGTINPIKEIVKKAKQINPKIIIIIDAAQAAPHIPIDVSDLGCDFLAFSAHKMLGPTGVGVLWGKYQLLKEMFPFQFGGEMIKEVYLDHTVFNDPPHKFEAGTPNIAGVVAFKEAINYLIELGWKKIQDHETTLTVGLLCALENTFNHKVKIFGPQLEDVYSKEKSGVVSFTFDKYHPHDIAQILDEENIAVRAGHHCAMPLHKRLGVIATVRASLYIYNSEEDVSRFIKGLKKVETTLCPSTKI